MLNEAVEAQGWMSIKLINNICWVENMNIKGWRVVVVVMVVAAVMVALAVYVWFLP